MKLDLSAPHQVYRAANGDRLPGVTTICGVIAKPHLLGWYANMERQGVVAALKAGEPLPVRDSGKILPFAEIKRDRAADLGTITHARCHAHDIGEELDPEGLPADLYEQSQHGLDRWVEWVGDQGFTLVACEKQVVCEDFGMRYGGTIDRLFTDRDGRKVLVDLKTSKRSQWWPYDETFAQVCGYALAEGDVGRIIVVRVGKEPGDWIQVYGLTEDERMAGRSLFEAAYEAYCAKRALEMARR